MRAAQLLAGARRAVELLARPADSIRILDDAAMR
jgi:hypothetical protein